jgi:hypothetical protein
MRTDQKNAKARAGRKSQGRVQRTPEMPRLVLKWLRRLRRNINGRSVDQLAHSLQAATLASRAGADDDIVIAALCHDIGKVISWADHGTLSAAIIKPYVGTTAYWVVATHNDFLAVYNLNRSGLDPYAFRERHAQRLWYRAALVFADEWDSSVRSNAPELSNNIIQKTLAFGRQQSGTVVNSER